MSMPTETRKVIVARDEQGANISVIFNIHKWRTPVPLQVIQAAGQKYSDIYLVPFHTGQKVRDSHNRPYNDSFPLRFYLPKTEPGAASAPLKKLFILMNGFGEGGTPIWDAVGDCLAQFKVASVLLPMPEHFCRNSFYNINGYDDNDPYHLREAEDFDGAGHKFTLRTYSNMMKYEAMDRPQMFIHCNTQWLSDLEDLVKELKNRASVRDDRRSFFDKFAPDVSVSLLGYSLGGLAALQGYLQQPDQYGVCVLLNSGASFQDMNAAEVFGKPEWRELQRGVVRAAHELGVEKGTVFEQVFLGNDKVELHAILANNNHKILILLGGVDVIINRKNIANLEPEETGLATFQVPGLEHLINIKNIAWDEWRKWSDFTLRMILAFEENRPPEAVQPSRRFMQSG